MPTGAQEVRVDRFDPDHHRTAPRRSVRQTALRNDDRPADELKLRAVASDAQPDLESERLLEPFHGRLAIGVESPSLVLSASVILVVGLAIQSGALGLYLAVYVRAGARAIIDAWRSSMFAGFMGALASQLWFVAFALSEAAPVRTLALIEVPMAQVVSLKMFREPPSLREGLGISLIVIAAGILVWTAR